MVHAVVQDGTFIALRLPSGTHKVVQIFPDITINLGKYGSVNTNLLLGRPYYLTYEIVDGNDANQDQNLRVVPASELHAEIVPDDVTTDPGHHDVGSLSGRDDGAQFEIVNDEGEVFIRNNRLTVDDPARQALSMEEIEELKKADTESGRGIILKIMRSHSALDQKTAFSLAKYTLRKSKKYLKRFAIMPLDVSTLTTWILAEREASKIMEIREEMLGIMCSWANVHFGGLDTGLDHIEPNSRILMLDDTGGLLVASIAERMNLLYPLEDIYGPENSRDIPMDEAGMADVNDEPNIQVDLSAIGSSQTRPQHREATRKLPDSQSGRNNTITLIHPATQPNIALLNYFLFDPADTPSKSSTTSAKVHPLHSHLKTISLLQLISPDLDGSYKEPEKFSDLELSTWKSSQRGHYYRKRRKWERTKRVVDETRAGGFDALVVASTMQPASILHYTVPLLKGGAQICIYSPNVESLTEVADLYSSSRKSAFLNAMKATESLLPEVPSSDFPVDPRLLLAPNIQTARSREWQVLPGRSHPLMTSLGAAEGFLLTGTRVLPAEGRVEARGRFSKKRKTACDGINVEAELSNNRQKS